MINFDQQLSVLIRFLYKLFCFFQLKLPSQKKSIGAATINIIATEFFGIGEQKKRHRLRISFNPAALDVNLTFWQLSSLLKQLDGLHYNAIYKIYSIRFDAYF